ncbi:TlpA disulfide reductase family protein [Paenibacillus sp. FJAT-26967]|uniref:TlpA family protein disulfide reductase n=1 Tax=Paenibacillus sp. FJAT-26967 TaxID=1729690 RepID=UPI0008394280|nr:TlpA disulfide reductase family protein [Paenibacillus sp. FJAT-26967]
MKRNAVIVAIVVLLAVAAFVQNGKSDNKETAAPAKVGPRPGMISPSFTLPDLEGKPYQFGGERSKPVILNFWASWCGPCKAEVPDLIELYGKYGDKVDLVAINITSQDSEKSARDFAKEYGINFPVLLDAPGDVTASYKFMVVPTSFLVGKDGVVREMVNVLPKEEWEKKIKDLIRDK